MTRWMVLLVLVGAGCAVEEIEEGDDVQEAAPDAAGADEGAEDVGELSQELIIGSYSASNTDHALNEANVVKIPVTIGGGKTVMIGTDGLVGASNQGDTVLRLFAPTGDHIKGNNDYACSDDLGSRLWHSSPYDVTKTFTVWAGCSENESCGENTVVISRMKGTFDFTANNTNYAKKGTTNHQYYLTVGQWIRASTCGVVAAKAGSSGDTFLRLYRNDGGSVFQVKANDDTSDCSEQCGLASTILHQVPTDGYYQVHAGCYAGTACSGTVAVYAE